MSAAVRKDPDQLQRILQMAQALGGESLSSEKGTLLAEIAVDAACAFCRRRDVPPEMEQAVARLLLELESPLGQVSTVQRGDTAVTYKNPQSAAQAALRPFCRLGTLEEGDA